MINPGMRRRMSAGRPSGRNSKVLPGMSNSDEEETGGGAVTNTGGRVMTSDCSGARGGGCSCALAAVALKSPTIARRQPVRPIDGMSIEKRVIPQVTEVQKG